MVSTQRRIFSSSLASHRAFAATLLNLHREHQTFGQTMRRHLATSNSSSEESNIAEADFEDLAEALLSGLENALDKASPVLNPEEVSNAYGVLTLDLGKRGTWVINKQTPNKQIWWSSPLSGPRRFAFNLADKKWHWTRDPSETLDALLSKELKQIAPDVNLVLKL